MKIIIVGEDKTVVSPGKGLSVKYIYHFYVKHTDGIFRKATREDLPDNIKNYSMTKDEAKERFKKLKEKFDWI